MAQPEGFFFEPSASSFAMIDTVRLKVLAPWNGSTIPSGWVVSEGAKVDTGNGRMANYRAMCDVRTGFRISGTATDATAVEVSLPRLLHGSNGALLKSEDEVKEAFRLMGARMEKALKLESDYRPAITRLDAAWNCEIDGGVRTVIRSVENARHANVRRATVVYKGESIHWPGTNCRVRIYDKGKEVLGRESNVVRFEAQFREKWVKPFNENPECMGQAAYQALREAVLKLQVVEEPRFGDLASLFAYMEQDGVRDSQGRDVLAIYRAGLSRSARYRIDAQIRAARVNYSKVIFSSLFPAGALPPVVEIREAA